MPAWDGKQELPVQVRSQAGAWERGEEAANRMKTSAELCWYAIVELDGGALIALMLHFGGGFMDARRRWASFEFERWFERSKMKTCLVSRMSAVRSR